MKLMLYFNRAMVIKAGINGLLCAVLGTATSGIAMAKPTSAAIEFSLRNGMKVIVREDHRAAVVAHMIWYKLGSVDERNGTTGVAHVLEHMMFKGSRRLKPGEFSARVAALGGQDNAFTSKDYTAYFEQIGSAHLETMMAMEAERMANLRFDAREFANELRVVMEERRWRTDDQALALLEEALLATAFSAHPYRHPIIGWMDDLQHLQVTDAEHWYRHWYAPNNATLVVSGDVDAARVRALAERYFSHLAARRHAPTRPQNEPPQRGIKRVTVKAPAENPHVVLAFKAPALRNVEQDSEPYALEVLAAVLDGYDNARLNAQLVRSAKVANEAAASYASIARGPVLFTLEGTPVQGTTTAHLEGLLRAEVTRIAEEGVSAQELQRVKASLVAGQIYKRDSIFGQAMEIGMFEMSGLSHRDIDRVMEKLRQVTPQQVQAVAAKYFGDDSLTVATLVPLPLAAPKPPPPAFHH